MSDARRATICWVSSPTGQRVGSGCSSSTMSASATATAREPGRVAARFRNAASASSTTACMRLRRSRTACVTSSDVVCQSEVYIPGSRMVTSTPVAATSSRNASDIASTACLEAA